MFDSFLKKQDEFATVDIFYYIVYHVYIYAVVVLLFNAYKNWKLPLRYENEYI